MSGLLQASIPPGQAGTVERLRPPRGSMSSPAMVPTMSDRLARSIALGQVVRPQAECADCEVTAGVGGDEQFGQQPREPVGAAGHPADR